MKTKEGWFSRKGMRVEHYVLVYDDGGLHLSSLCGAHCNLPEEPWQQLTGLRHCKRCEDALAQRGLSDPVSELKDPKLFEMEINYHQVIGETVPLAWIPVPDIKMVIDLLKRVKAPETCSISSGVISLVVDELQTRIREAEERCSLPSTVTATWSPPEEE